MTILKNLNDNLENIKKEYGNSGDLVTRIIKVKNKKVAYVFLQSVSSDDKISDFLMKNISSYIKDDNLVIFKDLLNSLKNTIYSSNISVVDKTDDLFYKLSSGFTCIFVDGHDQAISIETKSNIDRGINESTSEMVIRGPKDSFNENHEKNLGLIRKRIKDRNLWFKDIKVGRRTKTKVTISYINGIAQKDNIDKIEKMIREIDIDGILDSGYIREFLTAKYKTSFPQIISTERPDLVCGSLLEGKIVILVENSPFALIVPGLFVDFLHASEDYYQKPINVTLTRLVRFMAFILTLITPAFYIAVTTWNQEVIPNELLISLSIQKAGVPFPTTLELLMMIVTFEILREADIRIPNNTGAAISIVGALILGEAAVSAGIVSPIIIIVVALTSISSLLYTDIDFINGIRWWRFIFIIFASLLGFIGLIFALLIFLTKMCSINYLGIPYMTPIAPLYPKFLKDGIVKTSLLSQKQRPPYLTKNTKRMGDNN